MDIQEINVEDLASGLYIISMTTGKGVIVEKVQIK